MFTCGHHLPILSTPVSTTYPYSQPQSIQFTPSNSLPFKMHFNTILPFIPRFPTCFFLSRFPHVFSFQVSHVFSCHVSHMFFPVMFPTCFFLSCFPHVFSFHVSPRKPCIHFSSPTKVLHCHNLNPCMTFSVCTDYEADCCSAACQGS